MSRTTLKDKGQLTLPAETRKQIQASRGDIFEVETIEGKVVLTPLRLVPAKSGEPARRKSLDLSKYIGAISGTYGDTVEEMDAYVRSERDLWD